MKEQNSFEASFHQPKLYIEGNILIFLANPLLVSLQMCAHIR